MSTLIYFNRPDCPENMGISQLTSNLEDFLIERSSIIINPIVEANKITFTKGLDENGNPIVGYAIFLEVQDDFQN